MMDDKELKDDITAELLWDPAIDATGIGVSVQDGVATISGQVKTFARNEADSRAVHRTPGVRGLAMDRDLAGAPPGMSAPTPPGERSGDEAEDLAALRLRIGRAPSAAPTGPGRRGSSAGVSQRHALFPAGELGAGAGVAARGADARRPASPRARQHTAQRALQGSSPLFSSVAAMSPMPGTGAAHACDCGRLSASGRIGIVMRADALAMLVDGVIANVAAADRVRGQDPR